MSVNFSQNTQNTNNQENFGAGIPNPSDSFAATMLKSMELPTNRDEFVKFMPYFIPAAGLSKWVSHLAGVATRLKPTDGAMTAAESYNKSLLGRLGNGIDKTVIPVSSKYATQISATKGFFSRITPNWIKNLWEKIYIGVTPKSTWALSQYRGMPYMQTRDFIETLRKLPPDKIASLGLEHILQNPDVKVAATQAISALDKIPAKQLRALVCTKGKNLHVLEELTKTKAFLGMGSKTAIGRAAKKGFMCVSEAAGGGVIGGNLFGILMNSVFLASTLKRTWQAPWGEKFSTFMEGALVDFCGGYLMALLGTKLAYKILGIKNLDKTAAQLGEIKTLTDSINMSKLEYKELLRSGTATKEVLAGRALEINKSIEQLRILKGFQKATGVKGFFRNLIYRPIKWIGDFFCVGLESLPSNVAGQTMKNGKLKNISALRVCFQKMKNFLKGAAGYPMRFLFVMMVVTPPLHKLCGKISHSLFGKPTKSLMDEREGKNENNQAGKNQQKLDKMELYSQYTKAIGMARAMAEAERQKALMGQSAAQMPQNPAQRPQGTTQVPQIKTTQTMVQPPQAKPKTVSDISPATYVPTPIATAHNSSPLSEAIQREVAKADSLISYAHRGLAESKKESFDF